jgi:hypothetical protein
MLLRSGLDLLWYPRTKLIYNRAYPRKGGWPGLDIDSRVCELFTRRNLLCLALLFNEINKIEGDELRNMMKFCFLATLVRQSKRVYKTSVVKHYYHIPPIGKEQNVWLTFERKFMQILRGKEELARGYHFEDITRRCRVFISNAWDIPLPPNSIDYVFTDPPHGGQTPYYELNLFFSAWLGKREDFESEIIIPMDYDEREEYVRRWGSQIERAFRKIYEVLKPGRYCTVFFQSRSPRLWKELYDVLLNRVGFFFFSKTFNLKGTTFHTNRLDSMAPQTVFLTFKKPT